MPSYTVGYIDVYRNGVRLVSTDFTATTGTTVVLVNACTSGDSVVTESFYVSSVLNAIPATAGAVSNSYLAALSTITTSTGGTITIPTPTGTMMVSGNMPAFSAYANASQNISASTFTKVAINTEYFDTASAFDSTTNYRFTPLVAGYYQVNGTVSCGTSTSVEVIAALYKNGSVYSRGTNLGFSAGTLSNPMVTYNEIVYLNGSTDYIELYGLVSSPTASSGFRYNSTDLTSRFSAAMVRGA